jgi:phenylalanyl-tRNA synthetase beta chain
MFVLLSWLREFVPLEAPPSDIAETLSDLGLGVEAMDAVGEGLGDIVVARVVERRAHPDADKIQLVDVDAGDGDAIQVVCGAFNFEAGDLVPLAPVGTTMPGGMEIGRRKMRGEWSNGMLCSPSELGLGADHSGIMVLDPHLEVGQPLTQAIDLEVDTRFDLEVNPNRPDAMSVVGVARDLAARLQLPFTVPQPTVTAGSPDASEQASVEVLDPDLCGRFFARLLRGVRVGPSPARIATRLRLCGMRPISNVVDVSNYVMLELGQPNHPYDIERLGGRGIRVRRARDREALETLDGVKRVLGPDDLLICDAEDTPVGIAGIMGGAATEIADSTTEVLLEMAWFQPMAVARTAKRLNLRSEASARFERGCDPEVIGLAADRFCELLGASVASLEVASGDIDVAKGVPERPRIVLRGSRVNLVLGTDLTTEDAAGLLARLGFETGPVEDGTVAVTVPSHRPDCSTEIDLIEEVARLHGYQRIAHTVPASPHTGGLTAAQHEVRHIREVLAGMGLDEVMPVPFVAPEDLERSGAPRDHVAIANPLVHEESALRTSLLPGLLRAVAYNASHRRPDVRLMEIGAVWRRGEGGGERPDERRHVGVALGDRDARDAKEVADVLVDALRLGEVRVVACEVDGLHPTRTARLESRGDVLGVVGEVDPAVAEAFDIGGRVGWMELDLDALVSAPRRPAEYEPVSRYPSSDIDLAFVVGDDIPAAHVEHTLREAGGSLLIDVELFDVYRGDQLGEERRSLAFRLRFQAGDHTLTDEEVAEARRACIAAVEVAHWAELRG